MEIGGWRTCSTFTDVYENQNTVTEINVYTVTSVIIREKNIQSVIAGDIEEYQWEIEKRPLSADNGSIIHELIVDDVLDQGPDLKQCFVSIHKGFDFNEMKNCKTCLSAGNGSKKCKTSKDKVKNDKTIEKENKSCKTLENKGKNGKTKKERNKIELGNEVNFKGKRNKKQKRCCLSCCLGFQVTKKSKKH